jgi:L,D-peptidoglycan transpeptidase YkuD (ErfK/YbiS/YcfS/YnhG family)
MRRLLIVLCALVMSYAAMAQGVVVTSTGERITLPNGCKQAIVVVGTTGANCKVYKMTAEGTSRLEWRYELIEGVTGYAGIAAKDRKREGDGKTPQGLYALNRGLYYVNDFTTKFPMEQYYERYIWDENPYSATYNTLLRNPAPGTKGDKLWEHRNLQYRYIVVVEYNTDPVVKGAGSAIFIHAWRSEGKPTAGCVGMAEEDVRRLIERLDPKLNPHIVILGKQTT